MDAQQLPGGILLDGQVRRSFTFKAVTGEHERLITESGIGISSLAEQVTKILVNTLDTIAGLPATQEMVLALSSGDRQFLLHRLHAIIEPDPKWLTSSCKECNEHIQFQLTPGILPLKPAGDKFPNTSVTLSIGDASIRVPSGADEEAIASVASDPQSTMELLLNRLVSIPGENTDIAALSFDDQQLIDHVLENMSPQLSESVRVTCPYCEYAQEIMIDNYAWIVRESANLDEEIHTLAFRYHWSEKDILSLSKSRRRHYIKLIEKDLGILHDNEHNAVMQGGTQ